MSDQKFVVPLGENRSEVLAFGTWSGSDREFAGVDFGEVNGVGNEFLVGLLVEVFPEGEIPGDVDDPAGFLGDDVFGIDLDFSAVEGFDEDFGVGGSGLPVLEGFHEKGGFFSGNF